ncbi:ADP-ribosyl-[dinitrogen reductase] glycohydrolase [Aquisphaera giovannonii]|uniref:ADP-ribosyl-[dinitrogen reductase] glycohydrolase n=1 Tax=Aquisphaera giovannonii TaxID=406548 RepID=A0A5B9W0C8_9BACT|nr:ADP-ribosylglycohydrolase family protein [Aquisphaera giovannonii]QEH33699.1 ADP-ribosyl-[dinitrogen reductase] glycohydrolase [Aquisphaera giovannonii]
MPHLSRIDRVRGSLLGLAVGDALGAPLEGLTSQQIRTHYGRIKNYVDGVQAWKRKPYRWRMRGLYSDDTQQALAICDVLLECGRVDPDRLARTYVDLANPRGAFAGAHRGIGRSFRKVLANLEGGTPPLWSGHISAGIGAAMRIAPVGLFFEDQGEDLYRSVLAASIMTHRDVRSLAGALAVAHGVRRMAAGEPRDASLLLWVAADVARDEARIAEDYGEVVVSFKEHARSLSRALAHAESLLDQPRERALSALVEEANRHGAVPACRKATMGFPPACIPTCFYLLLTTDSFEEALVEVVNLGGDTDTSGAILGALAGAYYGIADIPRRWLDGLQNRCAIDLRAQALSNRTAEGLDIPDLISTEHELTRVEGETLENQAPLSRNGGDRGANRVV